MRPMIPATARRAGLPPAALAFLLPAFLGAQGRHVPPIHPVPPVRIQEAGVRVESTKVAVEITDGVAETTVTLVLRNDGAIQGEKILLLPLPRGAVADRVRMRIGGQMLEGEVLAAGKARRIYESIVAKRRDPALLEYYGRDTIRLRVFPVPPKGRQTVEIRTRMLLPESGGLYRWEFPARAVEEGTFAIDLRLRSSKALKNVYSPIQVMDISRKGDHEARAGFECKGRPGKDPLLFYGLSDREFGLNLLTYRPKGEDGYFLCMISPKRDRTREPELRKSITFVLDVSGSMQGGKIEQARSALVFFLKSLDGDDRFNIVPFSTEARPFAPAPVRATPENLTKALAFARGLEARGGTNLAEALDTALAPEPAEGLVPILVLLTDGLPTVGRTSPKEILASVRKRNRARARIFVLGVGYDVNTFLLDSLSRETKGTRDYIAPNEDLEIKTSALFTKLSNPVMTDLELKADGIEWTAVVPGNLPDLFRGGRLIVVGRYRGAGPTALRLRGRIGKERKEFVYDAAFPAQRTDHAFVAALWAQRRLGQLLEAIRLNGRDPELIREIERIGRKHGLVTPYTSQILVEEGDRLARASGFAGNSAPSAPGVRTRMKKELRRQGLDPETLDLDREEPEVTNSGLTDFGRASEGKKAVEESILSARYAFANTLDEKGGRRFWKTQKVGGHVFHLVSGFWIDGKYRKEMEKILRRIRAFSPEYFELCRKHPEVRPILAFSTALVLVLGEGEVYEILPPAPKGGKGGEGTPGSGKGGRPGGAPGGGDPAAPGRKKGP